jgi:hypothetical protein
MWIVLNNGSSGLQQDAARSSSAHVSEFNAHLRLMPMTPDQYRVVLTFHHGDGRLCEAALTPLEACELVSEIAHVLEHGDRCVSRSKLEESAE